MELRREEKEFAVCSIFLPEEILTKILQRLHIRPLFRFKCVSKQWNSIISNPQFGQCYMQQANSSPESRSSWRLWGMLCTIEGSTSHPPIQNPKPASALCDIDNAPPSLYVSRYTASMQNYHIILSSSNGLILSRFPPNYSSSNGECSADLCISNPLTKQSARLPSIYNNPNLKWAFGLATRTAQLGGENPPYVTYKVVIIGDGLVMIFSSDTGRWTSKKLTNCPPVYLCSPYTDTFTSKGVLHWFVWGTRSIATYDPYNSPDRFGCIQLPNGSDTIMRNSCVNLIQLWDEEMIEFGDIEDCMRVWRLVDHAKGEWLLDQTCVINPLYKDSLGSRWRKLAAWNSELFCCLDTYKKERLEVIDVGSAEQVFEGRTTPYPSADDMNLPVHITVCPWSSPFYRGARSNSSFVLGFVKIARVWFPSFDH